MALSERKIGFENVYKMKEHTTVFKSLKSREILIMMEFPKCNEFLGVVYGTEKSQGVLKNEIKAGRV